MSHIENKKRRATIALKKAATVPANTIATAKAVKKIKTNDDSSDLFLGSSITAKDSDYDDHSGDDDDGFQVRSGDSFFSGLNSDVKFTVSAVAKAIEAT